jgi:hypothetical protein
MNLNAAWQQAYRALKYLCLIEDENLSYLNQIDRHMFPHHGIRAAIMKNTLARSSADAPLYGT